MESEATIATGICGLSSGGGDEWHTSTILMSPFRLDWSRAAGLGSLGAIRQRWRGGNHWRPLDFSLFQKIDHGRLRTTIARKATLATTYVFGNALIAVQMTTHDARARLYVPLRLFVQEIAKTRVMVTYDLPSATMMQFGVLVIDDVARSPDDKVQRLLDETVLTKNMRSARCPSRYSTLRRF
jgi:hypothetical protein